MSNIILFDGQSRDYLLPLTYSRPVASLRLGVLTIAEKWERHLDMPASFMTQDYLTDLFPLVVADRNLLINGDVLPTPELLDLARKLTPGQACRQNEELIIACLERDAVDALASGAELAELETFELEDESLRRIKHPADIFALNGTAIRNDFALLTAGRTSAELSPTNTIIGPRENLFVEEGVKAEACIFNVEDGPVYLGKECIILEGSLLRSPLAWVPGPRLGERSTTLFFTVTVIRGTTGSSATPSSGSGVTSVRIRTPRTSVTTTEKSKSGLTPGKGSGKPESNFMA